MTQREYISSRIADLVATCLPTAAVMNRMKLRALINEEIEKSFKDYPKYKEQLDRLEASDRAGWAAFLEQYEPDKAPVKHFEPNLTIRT
jgi:hypothetical protein